ncbi:gamma-D-glutamyl-{L}-meso-diaminopimelate peptidase I Metallo peptidase. MEROPS family M14C [Gracilibacillus ureilyticus]|uniref:Gamma-D-glutamyl-(L)-meso-diaminopimelate peptidase I Metallo peptidase. MEROPS family M14C n=1 Tax=Gracilibacillus ureilyticus TaxID=531814 RepID=A0A1H9PHL0_9BACI|nr:M14 family metallopeptidase [Gracilibacillus ureilyticus]SER47627.1 gamma-D-glutamyl-{L}-meso-diaminopimelate peptidase I Metallo peptidase. MEROPS family M14C [Gracilibacillus ureilyticus]
MIIRVRQGDSLWYYSQLFNLPLSLIYASIPDNSPNLLFAGQQINIPGYVSQAYIIKPKDTLWNIAQKFNIPLDSLFLLNQDTSSSYLQPGQQILIPARVTNLIVTDINPYTYEKMIRDINDLTSVYPFILKRTIGRSVLGRDLIELEIGNGESVRHINGSFHANEWITTPVIMRFINEYALALTNNQPIRGFNLLPYFEAIRLSFVPMVNPDGVNLVINGAASAGNLSEQVLQINMQEENFNEWKANINGVDLNNQYPALWEKEAARKPAIPSPRDFPGYQPLTEPEAIAMAQLAQEKNFDLMNAFHTQGEVIYWGFEGLEPPIAGTIANEYQRVSGYTPIQYVDSYAGYKDWFIQQFRKPGYTVELGTGINPLPTAQFDEIYEETLGIMLASLYV